MSRNLGRTDCYFCQGEARTFGQPRRIRPEDAGGHLEEYRGMIAAHAACVDCEAQYLAWIDTQALRRADFGSLVRAAEFREDGSPKPLDLSFRSTFDDQPGADDLPRYKIITTRSRVALEGFPIVEVVGITDNAEDLAPHLARFGRTP